MPKNIKSKEFSKLLEETLQNTENILKHPEIQKGISTGLTDLDQLINGIQNDDVVLLAAAPGMGRTQLGLKILKSAAYEFSAKHDTYALYFSLGMNGHEFCNGFISMEASLPSTIVRSGKMTSNQFDDYSAAVTIDKKLPILVCDDCHQIDEIIEETIRISKKRKLGLIFIDNLQRIWNSKNDYSLIMSKIKDLGKKLKTPIVILSTLPKLLDDQKTFRPKLCDLNFYGDIAYYATKVLFLYREVFYLREKIVLREINEKPENYVLRLAENEEKMLTLYDKAEIFVKFNRSGPVGNVKIIFDLSRNYIGNLESN